MTMLTQMLSAYLRIAITSINSYSTGNSNLDIQPPSIAQLSRLLAQEMQFKAMRDAPI